jgi:glyoxylase-like metal-dependent hydrolase (beta-lactamase superfamily II)/8-oxo-dGTP pyrophosphatase MutT (NUDIX family)
MDPTTHPTLDPRPASTLVVLRDGANELEVLLTVRPRGMRFMGGAVVFPGGSLATADRDPRWARVTTLSGEQAAVSLGDAGSPEEALGYFVCALREASEEVGFPTGGGTAERSAAEDPNAWLERWLDSGRRLHVDRLVPAGRWVTPLGSPIRFDARFFLAAAPEGWEPDPDPEEVAACYWSSPPAALEALASGKAIMAPPTIEMLQRLQRHDSLEDALSSMRNETAQESGRLLSARLSPLVQVVLAPNPGIMTGPGTNTYIVGAEASVVIDPAVDSVEFLEAVVSAAGEVSEILVTHRHEDHVGGAGALASMTGAPVRAFGREPAGGADVQPIGDGEVVQVPRTGALQALHTPGHASDHLCFSFENLASLFSGDNILGEGTSVIAPPDGNMGAYLESLRRLRTLELERIYPGHFRPLDGGDEVIDRYLEHRVAREAAILESMRAGANTLERIVSQAYADTPDYLHEIAAFSTLAHLEFLESKGEVEQDGEVWRTVDADR